MEQTLDQVRAELAAIHDELLALPRDDFSRRAELQERRNELRQKSRELAEGLPLHDRAALLAAFNRLQELRDRLVEAHLPGGDAVGVAGLDNGVLSAVNQAISSGVGIDEIELRLAEIVEQLKSSE